MVEPKGSMEKLDLSNKLVLFDLDGTLVDTKNQIFQAVKSTRTFFNYEQVRPNTIWKLVGLDANELFADLKLNKTEVFSAVEQFRKNLIALPLSRDNLFPKTKQLLIELISRNCRLGIVTNKPKYLALRVLQETEIQDFFELVIGGDILPKKPDPSMIIYGLKSMNTDPSLTYMIGDRMEDIEAARQARVTAIGISQGPHSENDLVSAGSQKVFSSIAELYNHISETNTDA